MENIPGNSPPALLGSFLHHKVEQQRDLSGALVHPNVISNGADVPQAAFTLDRASTYRAITSLTSFSGKSCLLKAGTLSKAFSKSMNMWHRFFFFSVYFCWICLKMNIAPVVDFLAQKPNWLSPISITFFSLPSKTFYHSFIRCSSNSKSR